MKLSKTNGGNWAKQVGIGSDFKSLEIFATREDAVAAAGKYTYRTEIREVAAQAKLVERLRVNLGDTCFMVGRVKKMQQVMQHASRTECEAAGVTPGPCNI